MMTFMVSSNFEGKGTKSFGIMRFLLFSLFLHALLSRGLNWLTCNCNRVAGLLQPSDSPVIEAFLLLSWLV